VTERKKSQKGFVAVTLITVLAIALVLVVYASLLQMFTGGEVVVGTVAGSVYYSKTNTEAGDPWALTLSVNNYTDPWYARFLFTSTYQSSVTILWQLQKMGASWGNVTGFQYTSIVLNGNTSQPVYASYDGSLTSNRNWGGNVTANGQYRILAYVSTAD